MKFLLLSFWISSMLHCLALIDREAVVSRHDVLIQASTSAELDTANDVITIGNGAFAFNVDITGLQTFNDTYTHLNLQTLADWGWHSTPFSPQDPTFALRDYNFTVYSTPVDGHGGTRNVPYMNDGSNSEDVVSWLMGNPHRLHLGQVSLRTFSSVTGKTSALNLDSVVNASQALRIFTGVIESNFSLLGDADIRCALVDDNLVAEFSCGEGGGVITSVPWASYGQPSGSCTSGFISNPNCNADNTSAVLSTLCVGKPSCSILVNFQAPWGDPCSGKAKALAANITCSGPPPPSPNAARSVSVRSVVHPDVDLLSTTLQCIDDINDCPLALRLAFPYGSSNFGPNAADWNSELDAMHSSALVRNVSDGMSIIRVLDSDSYRIDCSWTSGKLVPLQVGPHVFDLVPFPIGSLWSGSISLSCLFSPTAGAGGALHYPVGESQDWLIAKKALTQTFLESLDLPLFDDTAVESSAMWSQHWLTGAFVDLASNTPDPAAFELERRVILSQYLLRANDAAAEPPQETGLLCNSWNGKHHNEMRLWHQAHWALWGRSELLERSNGFYFEQLQNATSFATMEGYKGAHWPKETATVANRSSMSVPWLGLGHASWPFGGSPNGSMMLWESVQVDNALIMWQQPHVIFLADLQRLAANASGGNSAAMKVVNEQAPLVFATADYIASRVFFNESSSRYMIGPPVVGGQECGDPTKTFNPVFEVVYSALVLDLANEWREYLGLARDPLYDSVAAEMAPLHTDPFPPNKGVDVYTFDDTCVCQFVNASECPQSVVPPSGNNCPPFSSHPLMLGIFGMINGRKHGDKYGVDLQIVNNTLSAVWANWYRWKGSWQWDDSLLASSMARLGWSPESIVSGPLNDPKFPYFKNGQTVCCPTYLPGNGGLLLSIAMLAAGSETSPKMYFPSTWNAQAEGFLVQYP